MPPTSVLPIPIFPFPTSPTANALTGQDDCIPIMPTQEKNFHIITFLSISFNVYFLSFFIKLNLKELLQERRLHSKEKHGPHFELSAIQASSVTLT